MSASTYGLGGHTVTLKAGDGELSQWVARYLAPFFCRTPPKQAGWLVGVSHQTEALSRLRAGYAACSHSNGERADPEHAISWTVREGGEWFVRQSDPDIKSATWWWTANPRTRRISVWVPPGAGESKYAVARIVRSLLMSLARKDGWIQVHASCFAVGGRGVLVCGEKGAGKTTILLTALRALGCTYVGNDRLMLEPTFGGFVAHGLPYSPSVRTKTLDALGIEMASSTYQFQRGGAKVRFLAVELCDLLGASITSRCVVDLVLFPKYSDSPAVRLLEPDLAMGGVLASVLSELCEFQPVWDLTYPASGQGLAWPEQLRAVSLDYTDDSLELQLKGLIALEH